MPLLPIAEKHFLNLLCLLLYLLYYQNLNFIVSTIPSKFKIYCAFIVSSKRGFFEFIVPVIVSTIPSKFDCAFIVSSKRAFFEFIVPVIVSTISLKFELYCAYYSIKIQI